MLKKEICGTYIWEIWDLDESFKELHFSGFVKELCEATEKNNSQCQTSAFKVTVVLFRFQIFIYMFFIVMEIRF